MLPWNYPILLLLPFSIAEDLLDLNITSLCRLIISSSLISFIRFDDLSPVPSFNEVVDIKITYRIIKRFLLSPIILHLCLPKFLFMLTNEYPFIY